MRAIIYARYSSSNQREASIEDQVRLAQEFVYKEGWKLVDTFSDKAISGSSINRPGYIAMINLAKDSGFDVLVTESLDRLSRDLGDIARLYKLCEFYDIQIMTLSEGEITDLHVGLKGTMNALYLKDLADKTRRGLRGRIEHGRSAGGNAYGYRIQPGTERGIQLINNDEATIVRRIFKEFIAGGSPIKIAKNLNLEGVPGPRGKEWRDTTIRGHINRGTGILNNELYIGQRVWNRLSYRKDPSTGKRVSRTNPQDTWIRHSVPELRMISDDLWTQAKNEQDKIARDPKTQKVKAGSFWSRKRKKYLSSGIAICGNCSSPLANVGRDYIACNRARKLALCDNNRSIKREKLENIILDLLKNHMMEAEHVELFIKEYHAAINEEAKRATKEQTSIKHKLISIDEKIEKLVDAIANGIISDAIVKKLTMLELDRKSIKEQLDKSPPPPITLHPNLPKLYRRKVDSLSKSLNNSDIRLEAQTIIRSLIEEVVLTPQGPNRGDGWDIDIKGDITHLVALGSTTKPGYNKASLETRTASSIKVVAGVGFEPTTFRL
jgi:site-specific DNA recombinase